MFFESLEGKFGWKSETLAIVLVVIVFNFIAKWLLRYLHRRFEKQNKIWKDSFVQALYAPLSCFTWFFALVYAINLIIPRLSSEAYLQNMHLLLLIAAILNAAWFVLRWKKLLVKLVAVKIKRKEIAIDQGRLDVINKLGTVLVIFLTLLMLLEVTNHSMTTLIAFGGVGGLAIAIASQEIIANFFGGLMIYVTQPFTIGDWINLPELKIEGHVEEIGWYMTRIRSFEKRPIYVPNATFTKVVVTTPSRMSHRRFQEIIGVRYGDLSKVQSIIADIVSLLKEHSGIAKDQKIQVCLAALGQHSLDISVSAFTETIDSDDFAYLKQDLLIKLISIVEKQGAELAVPVTILDIPNGIRLVKE